MGEQQKKRVSDSKVEWLKCVQYEDINPSRRLFGGRLMSWMDEVAGIAAIRHAGMTVTTAAVDNLQFKKGVGLGEILVIEAKVTYVGNTSMEVRVDVYCEEKQTGNRYPVNRAYFTEVCVDDEGIPVKVPYGLSIESDSEKAEWEGAQKRRELRKQRRVEGF